MANSVFQDVFGIDWPLGFIGVPNNGTPVNIMSLVDANNNSAPNTPTGPGLPTRSEYTPACHSITFTAVKPGNNTIAWQNTTGNVYIYRALGPGNQNAGGPQNRADTGALVAFLAPGASRTFSAMEVDGQTISPYRYTLDVDTNNDGAIVTLFNCGRG